MEQAGNQDSSEPERLNRRSAPIRERFSFLTSLDVADAATDQPENRQQSEGSASGPAPSQLCVTMLVLTKGVT